MPISHRWPHPPGARPDGAVAPSLRLGGAAAIAVCASLWSAAAFAQDAPSQDVVTFEEALARAAAAEPGLDAALAGITAAEAGVDQARRRLNPSLGVEAENFGGSGPLSGVDGIETTATIIQRLELGGDRRARIAVAQGDLGLARSGAVLRRLDLLQDVQEAYVEAADAAARLDLAEERLEIAQSVRSAVSDRVASALDPSVALARAELELENARAEVQSAAANEEAARVRLAGFWADGTASDFVIDLADFYDPGAHAREDDALAIEDSPDLALVTAAEERAGAVVEREIARGVQDIEVGAGVRHFNADGGVAAIAQVTIPLGLFDRNQGGVAAARADRTRLAYEAESMRRAVLREIAGGRRERSAAITRVDALTERVVPQAEAALAQAREGYARGAFSSLEVLDAQRALHDAREALVDALSDYHRADAALDRLTARFADPLPGEEILP